MLDPVTEAALNAWSSWLATEPDVQPSGAQDGVRVAVEVARSLIEASLRTEIDKLRQQLEQERADHRATTERLCDQLTLRIVSTGLS